MRRTTTRSTRLTTAAGAALAAVCMFLAAPVTPSLAVAVLPTAPAVDGSLVPTQNYVELAPFNNGNGRVAGLVDGGLLDGANPADHVATAHFGYGSAWI